jgi:hypothetical protein
MTHDIWDACRQQRAAEVERKMKVAAAVRKEAQALGATPNGDGKWKIACPHCGELILISEIDNFSSQYKHVRPGVISSSSLRCPSTLEIVQRVNGAAKRALEG